MRELNTSRQSAEANYYLSLVLSVFKCALLNTVQPRTKTILAKIIEYDVCSIFMNILYK